VKADLDRSVDAEVDPAFESCAAVTGVWGREIVLISSSHRRVGASAFGLRE